MIHWEDILETEDHKAALERLYDEKGTLEKLSVYLGVSLNGLRDKMMKEGIAFKPKGGVVNRVGKSRLDSLPRDVFETTPVKLIAKLYDMNVSAVYKYMRRRGITRETDSRKVDQGEVGECTCEGSMGGNEVEIQSSNGESGICDNGESGTSRDIQRGVQSTDSSK